MTNKFLTLFLVVALTWSSGSCGRATGSTHRLSAKANAPFCNYYGHNVVCEYLMQESDMALIDEEIQEALAFSSELGVYIAYSNGSLIPVDVFSGYDILYLELYYNDLPAIPYELFSNIQSPLTQISIFYNQFATVETTTTDLVIPFAGTFTELGISHTNIQKITEGTFAQFTKLQTLTLSYNDIKSLGLELSGLHSLTYLDLGDNDISAIESGTFQDQGNLQNLYLGANALSSLQEGAFTGLETSPIGSIDLSSNPWNCTCDLQWLKDWLNERGLEVYSGARCAYPQDAAFNDIDFC